MYQSVKFEFPTNYNYPGYSGNPTGSVKDYYNAISHGNMDINSSEEIWIFFSQFISGSTSIENEYYISNKKRELILRTDLLGRTIKGAYNGIVIYMYSDGTAEKKFELKP